MAGATEAEKLEADLRWHCARRLQQEWRLINGINLGGRLRPCAIEVRDLGGHMGTWCRATRTIAIDWKQVCNHIWTTVTDTLRHEMAHQAVDELYGLEGALPHGEAFRRACDLLGIDPAAHAERGPALASTATDAPEDARLRRIRGLLALAGSPDSHEAEAALAKANELLLRYNLDLAALNQRRAYVSRAIRWHGRRLRHGQVLSGILVSHFFVEGIWMDGFEPRTGETYRILELTGTKENVDIAEHTFLEVLRVGEELWEKHQRAHGTSGRQKGQYLDGLVVGFGSRLERERKSLSEERGLIWLGDPELAAFLRRRHGRLRRDSIQLGGSSAYDHGKADGTALKLRQALHGASGGGSARQLTGGA